MTSPVTRKIGFALLTALSLAFFPSCQPSNQVDLVRNGQSDFYIQAAADEPAAQLAATELQHFIKEMTGTEIPINPANPSELKKIHLSGKPLMPDSLTHRMSRLKEDGFFIHVSKDSILLAGTDSLTTLYATYTFLKEQGCMLFPDGEEFIPHKANLTLDVHSKFYEPDFSHRQVSLYRRADHRYEAWYKLEQQQKIFGMFVHTFTHLIPPSIYFKEHPEYYAWFNGKRNYESQLCLSNDAMTKELIQNLRQKMAEQPDKKFWSVSQNDYYNYCECDSCKAKYEKYGSYSGAYIEFLNKIADTFPDKQISTLAYQFTRSAPKNIIPRDNVNIMFCSIECNRSMPLAEDSRSASFVQDMKDWSAITDNIYVWDYVVQFQNYLCPFPNFDVLQPNVQFFKKHGVDLIFEQGSGGNWSDFEEWKLFLLSELTWNSKASTDSLQDIFFSAYYGPAAPAITKYYQLVLQSLNEKKDSAHLDIYGYPVFYTSSFLAPDKVTRYMQLLDSAEVLAANDSTALKHVWKTRVSPDYAYVDLAVNNRLGDIKLVHDKDGIKHINQALIDKLDLLIEHAHRTGITHINEKAYSLEDYREYVTRMAFLQALPNKLTQANVSLMTEPSPTYEVGGVNALTDGRFGGLHFRYNWLGFQGEHADIAINFPRPEAIKRVSMNFLTDELSWVFLPVSVSISISDDGKNYRMYKKVEIERTNTANRIASIPVVIETEGIQTPYLRVKAESILKCPHWHRGDGQPSWIFIDEIVVE